MARLNVKPTRMELSVLKKRLKTSTRGHKLLKDKQDELMRQFITLVRENQKLRQNVEQQLTSGMQSFVLAKASTNDVFIEESFAVPTQSVTVQVDFKNVMSVSVPQIVMQSSLQKNFDELSYGLLHTTEDMDKAMAHINTVYPNMIKLAEIEKTCQLLADDIEKTRRRVNALEHLIIPQLQETIRYIQMKLEENERSYIVRMMKIKN